MLMIFLLLEKLRVNIFIRNNGWKMKEFTEFKGESDKSRGFSILWFENIIRRSVQRVLVTTKYERLEQNPGKLWIYEDVFAGECF